MKSCWKAIIITMAAILTAAVILTTLGCEKPPSQEINDAKMEITEIENAEGTIYAAEELRQIRENLESALDEVKSQDEKLVLKKYDKAKEILTKVKTDADSLKIIIPKRREEVRNNALTAQNEAKTKIEEAKSILEVAPTGKGTQADIEAFKADLKGLEDSLNENMRSIDGASYFAAIDKAKIIQERADSIAQQIRTALERVRARS